MRRFVGLAVILFFSIPFGLAVSGCGHKTAAVQYCNAGDSGPVVGQVASITLSPSLATLGESLNFAEIGTALNATALDCKGNAVSVKSYTYASTSSFNVNLPGGPIFADINPINGQVCGGTWNRNVGGSIQDYTTCTAPTSTPTSFLAYVTATADGAVSNAIPVYVHPVVTGIVLGAATPGVANGSCPAGTSDPGTDCCPNSTVGTPIVAPVYNGTGCISQNHQAQFVARVYSNGTVNPANNITCQVGHLSYSAVSGASIVTIDQNGVATANQPGSTQITATLSNSGSSTQAGFFSTCPPASIQLQIPTAPTANSVTVNLNNAQPFTATVTDVNGNVVTGLNLEYNSTAPQNIPASAGSVTPVFPGSAVITAVCQPATCNVAPYNQIGLFGNGTPLTSNGITVVTPGTNSTVLYMASAADTRTGSPGSQYVAPYDFTINQAGTAIKLAYVPNSMVMNLSGTTIYLGSPQGLMTISTATNSASAPNQNVPGTVLSVSPDGTQIVVTDPIRQTISLVTSTETVETSYGGIGTSAVWTPDSQTVYVTTQTTTAYPTPTLLQYTLFTKWQPITVGDNYTTAAITVPNVGAYFGGATFTDGRSYCPAGRITSAGPPPEIANNFAPLADEKAVPEDQLTATSNGVHILGAHAVTGTGASIFNDFEVTLPVQTACPQPGNPSPTFTSSRFNRPLTNVNATAITGVFPSTNSVVAPVTYIGTGSVLPVYYPVATGLGTLINVPLANGATAPLAGVFSTDSLTFFTGTATDNEVHLITFSYPAGGGAPTATDSSQLTPNLPAANGAATSYAPVNLLAQYPKKSQK